MNKEAENKMDKKDMMESLEEIRRQFDADMHREIDLRNQEERESREFYLEAQRVAPLFAESLRDKFAMHAPSHIDLEFMREFATTKDALKAEAVWRYEYADAMMKQRSVDAQG